MLSRTGASGLAWCRSNTAEKNQNERERTGEEVYGEREKESPFDGEGRSRAAIPDLRYEVDKHLGVETRQR
jgi:hypothetical protein